MSNIDQMKGDAEFLKKGLFKLGRNRAAALSSHKSWLLTDEMEQRIDRLLAEIKKL